MTRTRHARRAAGWLAAIAAVSALVLAAPTGASATAGDLIPSYGVGGIAATHDDEPEQASGGYSSQDQLPIGVQPGGKPILAGRVQTYGCSSGDCIYQYPYVVERLGLDGKLDPSFGSDGITTIDETGLSFQVDQVVLQPDGKALIVGAARFDGDGLVVIRLDADGELDSSFGQNGVAEVPAPTGSYVSATHVAALPNGDVVAGINSQDYATQQSTLTIARLDQHGSPDPGFGSGGFVTETEGQYDYFESMLADSQGRILVVDVRDDPTTDFQNDPVVTRYLPDGSHDPAYGVAGEAKLPAESPTDSRDALTPADSVLRLSTYDSSELAGRLSSVESDGTFDRSFGGDGYVDLRPTVTNAQGRPQTPRINALTVQHNGRILIAGGQHLLGGSLLSMGRLLPDGAIDDSFGRQGYSEIYATPRIDHAGVLVLPGQRILLAGGNPGAKIVSAEYRGDPGTRTDADADRVRDTKDLCPQRFGLGGDGCPHHGLMLTLDFAHGGKVARGVLQSSYSPCLHRVTVAIFAKVPGPDPRIGRQVIYRSNVEAGQATYSIRVSKSPGPQRYAAVRRSLRPAIGVCRGVTSEVSRAG